MSVANSVPEMWWTWTRLLVSLRTLGVCALAPLWAYGAGCEDEDPRELCEERDIFLMPGIVGTAFLPKGQSDAFLGAGAQLAPLIWSHNNDDFGPGQGVVLLQAALLSSSSSDSTLGLFEIGTTLSLEKNSSRSFGIPYFGFTLGSLVHEELPDSSFVQTLLGAHLYFHHNLILDLQAGYHFPFQELDRLRGLRAQSTLRFSMW